MSFFLTALDVEREDRSTAVFEVLCIKCVVGVVGQRRVINLFNLGVVSKELYDLLCVLNMAVKS